MNTKDNIRIVLFDNNNSVNYARIINERWIGDPFVGKIRQVQNIHSVLKTGNFKQIEIAIADDNRLIASSVPKIGIQLINTESISKWIKAGQYLDDKIIIKENGGMTVSFDFIHTDDLIELEELELFLSDPQDDNSTNDHDIRDVVDLMSKYSIEDIKKAIESLETQIKSKVWKPGDRLKNINNSFVGRLLSFIDKDEMFLVDYTGKIISARVCDYVLKF